MSDNDAIVTVAFAIGVVIMAVLLMNLMHRHSMAELCYESGLIWHDNNCVQIIDNLEDY